MKKQNTILLIIVLILIAIAAGYLIYYQINNPIKICTYDSPARFYIKKDPNCVINFLCIKDEKAFKDECGCGCETINITANQTEQKILCTPEQKKAQVCPEYFSATCGWFNSSIQCIKYPCAQTFSNPCFACADENVDYYTVGECPK